MLDMKLIRQNPKILEKALRDRNITFDLSKLLSTDITLRNKMTQSQTLVALRNKLAKEIGNLKSQGKDTSTLIEQVSQSKQQEEKLVNEAKAIEEALQEQLSYLPNIPLPDVPVGADEVDNFEVKRVGELPKFAFTPKEHFDLGKKLGMMDFEMASSISGSRFVILKEDLALMERALANFMLDIHTKRGYTEYAVPVLVNEEALFNTAQLPKFKEELFQTTEGKWLIPTTEVPLTNLVTNSFIKETALPMRMTGLSLCFRSEVGSAGRDTKGMIRLHQFYKVELVAITHPHKSEEELQYMLTSAEEILQQLNLPYRVMLLCTGDMGFAAAKTYDIEAWLPGQNSYREISSCSVCTDFQARRMGAKVKTEEESTFVHTLNGSGLAVGRTLVAVLENYQREDGSIIVPEALVPYMNGKKVINKFS